MTKDLFSFLALFFLLPFLVFGQIPKGHFLDSDGQLKSFKQKNENLYHYAVLSELPFTNDCGSGLSEKEQIACSEKNLRGFIYPKISSSEIDFEGNVYVYLTITEDAGITDLMVKSYPNSETTNNLIKEAIKELEFRPGKFDNEIVKSRLWTYFTFPSSSNELLSVSLEKMLKKNNQKYEDYENLIFDASRYIFSNPVYPNGTEFRAALGIIDFWKDKDTGLNIPIFGNLYSALPEKGPHRYFYMVAMMEYILTEKLEKNRILKCVKIEGQEYRNQEDVKEVQLGGAKILLSFIGNEKNNLPMNSQTKKFFKAFEKGNLEDKLFE